MTPRRQRLLFACAIVGGVGLAVALALTAIQQNMRYFYDASQIKSGEAPVGVTIRVGGLVLAGSVRRGDNADIEFDVSDLKQQVRVRYTGILPDLFREGQGIIAIGRLDPSGVVIAEEVLAKHDENYMPPEVAKSLKENPAHQNP
ncbi:MAG TPA: cytochrome c maturation protein CcmE [Gammaproteobacteria bacterium]